VHPRLSCPNFRITPLEPQDIDGIIPWAKDKKIQLKGYTNTSIKLKTKYHHRYQSHKNLFISMILYRDTSIIRSSDSLSTVLNMNLSVFISMPISNI